MTQPLAAVSAPRGSCAHRNVRFKKPVLDGEEVTVTGVITARDARGVTATLTAGTADARVRDADGDHPAGNPTPVKRRRTARRRCGARPEATAPLGVRDTLGTPRAHLRRAAARRTWPGDLAAALYRAAGWLHPGCMLEQGTARWIARAIARITSQRRAHLGGARVGERLATRAACAPSSKEGGRVRRARHRDRRRRPSGPPVCTTAI